jgi:hypothetical protein
MKFFVSVLLVIGLINASAQKSITQPLPMPYYVRMLDSTTSIDVVFMLGQGGSISVEGRNTKLFNSFFENVTTPKLNTPQAGTMMWQINGKEFLNGSFYLGDSTGCMVITKNGKEYINRINQQGNAFLKSQGRK